MDAMDVNSVETISDVEDWNIKISTARASGIRILTTTTTITTTTTRSSSSSSTLSSITMTATTTT